MDSDELELYFRGDELKVFVSSRMKGILFRRKTTASVVRDRVTYKEAREAAAAAIEDFSRLTKPWYWECHAAAGPYYSEDVCLGNAQTSAALILLLGETLTRITRREFEVARENGVHCIVLVADGVKRNDDATQFIEYVRNHRHTTAPFRNLSELQSQVINSLKKWIATSVGQKLISDRHAFRDRRAIRLMTEESSTPRRLAGSMQEAGAAIRVAAKAGKIEDAARLALAAAKSAQEEGWASAALDLLGELEALVPLSALTQEIQAEVTLQTGQAQVWQGMLDAAADSFSKVLDIDRVIDNTELRVKALRGLGLSFHFRGNFQRARELYERARSEADKYGDIENAFKLGLDLVSLAYEENQIPLAQHLLNELESGPTPELTPPLRLNIFGIKGVIAMDNGDLAGAEAYFQQLLVGARKTNNPGLEFRAMREMGQIRTRQRKPGHAVRWFRKALHRIKDFGVFPEEVGVRIALALALDEWGRTPEAIEQLGQARDLAIKVNDELDIARATANLGILHRKQESFSLAESLFQRASDLFAGLGLPALAVQALRNLSETQMRLGAFDAALQTVETALEQAHTLPNLDHRELLRLGGWIVLGIDETPDRALSYFERAVRLAEELGETAEVVREAFAVCAELTSIGLVAEASPFLDRALAAAEPLGDHQMIFQVRTSRGIAFATQGRLSDALADLDFCLSLAVQAQDRAMEAIARLNLGVFEAKSGHPNAALVQLRVALSASHGLGNELLTARILLQMARAHVALEQQNEAEEAFRQAGSLAYNFDFPDIEVQAAAELGSIVHARGDVDKAISLREHAAMRSAEFAPHEVLRITVIALAETIADSTKRRSFPGKVRKLSKTALKANRSWIAVFGFGHAAYWLLDHGQSVEAAPLFAASILLALEQHRNDEEQVTSHLQGFIDSTISLVDQNAPEGRHGFYRRVLLHMKDEPKPSGVSPRTRLNELLATIEADQRLSETLARVVDA